MSGVNHLQCPLLALGGHGATSDRCPLLGVKRTWPKRLTMSAYDPKRTFALLDLCATG